MILLSVIYQKDNFQIMNCKYVRFYSAFDRDSTSSRNLHSFCYIITFLKEKVIIIERHKSI